MDINLIATSIVALLAPFTPFLIEVSKDGTKKLAEVIGEKGGEAIWIKAQALWKKIKPHLRHSKKIKGAALMLSVDPENRTLQKQLADAIIVLLKNDLNLAQELYDLLGGEKAIQLIIADNESSITNVTQHTKNNSQQTITANHGSNIDNAGQYSL